MVTKPVIDKEEASIAHLLETQGLEVTRLELETLFNLADEQGMKKGQGWSKGGASSQMRAEEEVSILEKGCHNRQRKDNENGLISFLRRCGQRRGEW